MRLLFCKGPRGKGGWMSGESWEDDEWGKRMDDGMGPWQFRMD